MMLIHPHARVRALLLALLAAPLAAQDAPGDPREGEVPLPCADGWSAFHIYSSKSGIWTVRSFDLLERLGCPEVVALDDRGHCTVLLSYSGKWTPLQTVEDGAWLGAIAHGDLDPRRPGSELYTGGKLGRLYQIQAHAGGGFDTRLIARFPGLELHTLIAGDLRPGPPGDELLVFAHDGAVFEISAPRGRQDGFATRPIGQLPGRVRDARILPPHAGEAPWIATVSRAGEVALLRLGEKRLERRVLLREPMGFGRLALRRTAAGAPRVLYVTRDDGLVLRLEESTAGSWKREAIYAGPQGPRGIVAGRFDPDPRVETIAIFGYSKKVQILARPPEGPWTVQTIFTDCDRGHWLEVAELDGRNSTDEILGSGYGKRVFLLARTPGTGLEGVPTDPAGPPQRRSAKKNSMGDDGLEPSTSCL